MSQNAAISVEHVSKSYRIWNNPASRLTAPMLVGAGGVLGGAPGQWLKDQAARSYRDFYALRDVSFSVSRGESVGIIGRNGSGKSTLLQIIAGTLQPTRGTVNVNGRVAALLELGSGFNPEFTGRENVMLNGAILGFTSAQMNAKFDEIADFADIGDFINQPVKIYSSGMMLRLAFAVQTAVEPNVLIIDEALSVGDAPFQAKCFSRIRHLLDGGCTILFVSHDIGTVRTFCQQAVWLQQGQTQSQGTAQEVCDAYSRDCFRATGMDFVEEKQGPAAVGLAPPASASGWLLEDRSEFQKLAAAERRGNAVVQLRNLFFLNQQNQRTSTLHWDEDVTVVYVLGSEPGYDGLFQLGMVCKTLQGQEVLCCSDRTQSHRLKLGPGEERVITLRTRLPLRAGEYVILSGVFLFPDDARHPIGTYDFTRSTVADFIPCSSVVSILPQFNLGIYGPVQMESHLALHEL